MNIQMWRLHWHEYCCPVFPQSVNIHLHIIITVTEDSLSFIEIAQNDISGIQLKVGMSSK